MVKIKLKFILGDLVYLKSGSPKMTVTAQDPEFVTVIWFGYQETPNTPHTATFPNFALYQVTKD